MSMSVDSSEPRHCLVVDDSRVVRKAARRFLEGFGFTVREAADGQEAMEACRELLPEIVLLDWNMPVMDGLTFLKAARAEFDADHPVIVLCTTEIGLDRIVTALEAGAQEYVMKPFDAQILGSKLEQLGLIRTEAA
ncbi:response regulator [Falsiroseomonas sp. E2-1-a20]|uniref:response regulator n=1 Tax=Falsiroseomonas sp. E2-1-a20 TaxID=3239300 RepID=UPI003F317B42